MNWIRLHPTPVHQQSTFKGSRVSYVPVLCHFHFIFYFIFLFISVFLFRLDAACFYEGPRIAILLWISVLLWSSGVSVPFMVALDHSVRFALYVLFMFYDRLYRYCFSGVIKNLWNWRDRTKQEQLVCDYEPCYWRWRVGSCVLVPWRFVASSNSGGWMIKVTCIQSR